MAPLEPLTVVLTADLFPGLHTELMSLLRGLSPEDWERPTIAGAWRVRDVAAHLLDVDLRKLSSRRDDHSLRPAESITGYGDLVRYIDQLNAGWVRAAERLSPRVLVDLLALSGPQVAALVASLPPHEEGLAVAWAGEARSENWFDVGREYTERWHHQAQIRDAVGAPALAGRRWLHPVLDLALRALPPAFQSLAAPEGTALVVAIRGDAGGVWSLLREADGWRLWRGAAAAATARARLDAEAAWRLLFNALPVGKARAAVEATGEGDLAERLIDRLLTARGVMV